MVTEGKAKSRTAEETKGAPSILDRLEPVEASVVLQHLVDAHPDLAVEATEIARALLRQQTYEDVAAEMEDELRALDYDALNARAGSHEWGNTEPSGAAWEIMEDILKPFVNNLRRHLELGLETEAKEDLPGLGAGMLSAQ
jgi:hypothetical protein